MFKYISSMIFYLMVVKFSNSLQGLRHNLLRIDIILSVFFVICMNIHHFHSIAMLNSNSFFQEIPNIR